MRLVATTVLFCNEFCPPLIGSRKRPPAAKNLSSSVWFLRLTTSKVFFLGVVGGVPSFKPLELLYQRGSASSMPTARCAPILVPCVRLLGCDRSDWRGQATALVCARCRGRSWWGNKGPRVRSKTMITASRSKNCCVLGLFVVVGPQ